MAKLKLNAKVIEKAIGYLEEGNYIETVATLIGITSKTYFDWINKGLADIEADKVSLYSKFCNATKEAQAEAERRAVASIQQAGEKSWQANAWYLERKFKDRWALRTELEVSTSSSEYKKLTEGELRALASAANCPPVKDIETNTVVYTIEPESTTSDT